EEIDSGISIADRLTEILWDAGTVGAFAATSSNIRYQAVHHVLGMLRNRFGKMSRGVRVAFENGISPAALWGNTLYGAFSYVYIQRCSLILRDQEIDWEEKFESCIVNGASVLGYDLIKKLNELEFFPENANKDNFA